MNNHSDQHQENLTSKKHEKTFVFHRQERREMCWLMHRWHLVYLGCCNGRDTVRSPDTFNRPRYFSHISPLLEPEEKSSECRKISWYKFKYLAESVSVNLTRTQRSENVGNIPGREIHLCWDCDRGDNRIIEHSCQENISNWWDIILNYFKCLMFSFHPTSYPFQHKRHKSLFFPSYFSFRPSPSTGLRSQDPSVSSKQMTNENCTCQRYHSINHKQFLASFITLSSYQNPIYVLWSRLT